MLSLPLVISITINILLVLAMFFKSSLNNIVTELWVDKRKEKKEKKKLFIELRSKLCRLTRLTFSIMINMTIIKYEIKTNPKEFSERKTKTPESFNEWSEINNFFVANEVYFPHKIRKMYQEYSGKVQELNGAILNKLPPQEQLIKMSGELQSLLEEMIIIVDREIESS